MAQLAVPFRRSHDGKSLNNKTQLDRSDQEYGGPGLDRTLEPLEFV
jgi:hypothetical protein